MCPSGFHHGFVATHVLGHMMYSYTLLVPMNQTVLNKVSKEHNISDHKWSTTQRVRKSHRSKMSVICALPVITTMSLWHIVFMIAYIYYARFASVRFQHCVLWITYDYLYYAPYLACWDLLGTLVPAMCNRTSSAQVHELPQISWDDKQGSTPCFHDWIYIMLILLLSGLSTVCIADYLWPLIYVYITLIFN